MQKLIFITSHLNHPKFKKLPGQHGYIIEESGEVNKMLEDGWVIKEIHQAKVACTTSYGYGFAILLEKK